MSKLQVSISSSNHKDSLIKKQQVAVNRLHNTQIAIEIILILFVLTFLTINISSVWPIYGAIDFIFIGLLALSLFIMGIYLTISVFRLKKWGEPIELRITGLMNWLIMTWCWFLVVVATIVLASTIAVNAFGVVKVITISTAVFCFFVTMIVVLITTHLLWKRFHEEKRFPIRPILYSVFGLVMILVVIFGTYTTTDSIKYNSTTVSDGNLELGQSEVKQVGKDGQKQITYNLIFGFTTSTSQTDTVDQITAKGTRRYQYMYCSDGSYRYYNAEQFKDINVGFTHQSEDFCAKNSEGIETTIADTPPAKTVVQQTVVKQSPSSFNCYSLYSGSVSCYGY